MSDARQRSMRVVAGRHLRGIGGAFAMVLAIGWILFATLVVVLRYAVLPHVDGYRGRIERIASEALGESVRIGSIEASWRGLQPSLALRDLQIVDAQGGNALELPSVRATLAWDSLLVLQLRLASLEIDGPQLVIRRDADGRFYVAGFPIRQKASPDSKVGEWFFAQHEIRVRKARLTWHDEMAGAARGGPNVDATPVVRDDLVWSDVEFALTRSGWRHRVALRATPPAELAAPIDLRAVIDHPLFASRLSDPNEWSGELYANVGTGDVVAWRKWLPLPDTVDAGHGRARVWLDFTDAQALGGSFARRLAERTGRPIPPMLDRIVGITSDLALDEVAVRWGTVEYAALASIDGRIVASQTPTEQRFTAMHMALQPRIGTTVPPTDFRFERTVGATIDDESGTASIGSIDIGVSFGLVPEPLVPPAIAEKVTALKPRGVLDGMTVRWTGPVAAPRTFQIDARFEKLALAALPPGPEAIAIASREIVMPNGLVRRPHEPFGQPGFENLGGTLSATRSPGATKDAPAVTSVTLKVGGDDAVFTAPGLFDEPVLRLAHFGAQVGVRVDGPDLEVKVEHGLLDNAEIAGTVDLTYRHGPASGGAGENGGRGWIDLDARIARAEVNRVPRYLPNIISPKARAYLVKALLGGKVTEGSLRMHGALEKLDLRAMPGALAKPNPVSVPNALIAVRDVDRRASGDTTKETVADDAIFHAAIKVKDATFLYGPARDPADPLATSSTTGQPVLPSIAWPVFEDLDADIVFDQAKMTIYGHSTRAYGFRLTDIKAELPALADPAHVLRVVGRGTGPLQDLVRFVNNSPVARWTRHFTETTRGTGNAGFALALDLPLTHPRDAEVAGSLQFVDNDLALNATLPPIRRINGRADFTDRGAAINGITAIALGGPLRVDAATRSDGFIDVGVVGTIDVAALKASAHEDDVAGAVSPTTAAIDRASQWLSGSAQYKVALRTRSKRVADLANAAPPTSAEDDAALPDLSVESDLVGLAIALPAPLAKGAAESWPLRIAIKRTPGATDGAVTEDIRVSLATLLAADVVRRRDAQGPATIARADYTIGGDRTTAEDASSIHVALPAIDVDAWRDVVRRMAGPARVSPEPTVPTATAGIENLIPAHATLRTPLLRAAGRDFTNVSVDARRLASGWQGDVVADQVAGSLSYTDVSGTASTRNGVAPPSSGRVVARLSRLVIPAAEAGAAHVDDTLDASRQKDFPAIDVVVDRFELRGRTLGRLEVVAQNIGEGDQRAWQLDRLGLAMPEARFAAHGVWGHAGAAEHTRLDFDIDASDVGALMDRFGMTRTIKGGTARLAGNAEWNGGPSTIDFASMEGRLALAADKGQFLKADPGIAKLLNILSLQGLARRLTLDFKDVFEAGFAFDTVRADAVVSKGIATTDDFTMKGVQATVTMSGSADLEHESTDLHVKVAPDINAGAASLGVAVINPVIGLATFAAQYLFKDRIAQALSFEYNVRGPWSKPEVTKIDRHGHETPVQPRKATASSEQQAAPHTTD